jgi:hypothetical protein
MVTLTTLGRLAELEARLASLGLEECRGAVDEALPALGAPLPREGRRRTLALGRKANRGALTAAERAEYIAGISEEILIEGDAQHVSRRADFLDERCYLGRAADIGPYATKVTAFPPIADVPRLLS